MMRGLALTASCLLLGAMPAFAQTHALRTLNGITHQAVETSLVQRYKSRAIRPRATR